jgi:two-component system, chemotaxis family, chemotaxis protein CheY
MAAKDLVDRTVPESVPMKKLLIVDDSKAMRMIVRRSLRQANLGEHTIDEATNGEEALQKLRTGPFDLVLADWNMPQMNGIDLLKTVRAEGMSVHFGFVTSEGTDDIRQLALDSGAQFLIVKPFTPEALHDALAPLGLT